MTAEKNKFFLFCPVVLVLLLSGCSTIVNSHLQKAPMMEAYIAGDNQSALQEINEKLKEPHWYNSSVINTGDELHWQLEAGTIHFYNGNYQQAIDHFTTAEKLITQYDERAKISVQDIGAETGVLVTNLNALPYRGFCRDRIALNILKSLAYLGNGKEDSFRAQIKRLRNEQKKVMSDYREFFDQEQQRLADAKNENPQSQSLFSKYNTISKLLANGQNTTLAENLKQTSLAANKGYADFLNPAAIFLSALVSLRDGNISNARIDFQRFYEAVPDNPAAQKYFVTALLSDGKEVPETLKDVLPFDFPLDRDCVFVIFANGRGAAFKQISIDIPVSAAWPVCEFYPADFSGITAIAGGKAYHSTPIADMDGIIAREFEERLPLTVTRIILSTAIKEAAKYTAAAIAYSSSNDDENNELAAALVFAGATIYNAAMNTADTRSWELLPKEFQLTQFPMPDDRKIKIELAGKSKLATGIEIPDFCRSAIIFVNASSSANVTCHILPLYSK